MKFRREGDWVEEFFQYNMVSNVVKLFSSSQLTATIAEFALLDSWGRNPPPTPTEINRSTVYICELRATTFRDIFRTRNSRHIKMQRSGIEMGL